jgi:hypothetical protein
MALLNSSVACRTSRISWQFLLRWLLLLVWVWVIAANCAYPSVAHPKELMCAAACVASQDKKPLKVFLLVGQSNMQGHGHIDTKNDTTGEFRNATLEWLVQHDPAEYGMLKESITNETSRWTVRQDVFVAYNKQGLDDVRPEIHQYGYLHPMGYGGDPGQENQMGPELGFGWTIGESINDPNDKSHCPCHNKKQTQILLLKIAWGGKSLDVDFRPPSSIEQGKPTGLFYEAMLANTFHTLAQLKTIFPDYTGSYEYELAGLVWHQGWNDGCDANQTAHYERNMANFIRDVRHDLGVPNLPVVIGVSGMTGYQHSNPQRDAIIAAQFAVANTNAYPEFAGTVATVETRDFARGPPPHSPGDQIYHWNNNCESYWLIGKAMGQAMVELLQTKEQQDQEVKQNNKIPRQNDGMVAENTFLRTS